MRTRFAPLRLARSVTMLALLSATLPAEANVEWLFNPSGNGLNGAIPALATLPVRGSGLVSLSSLTATGDYTFVERGAYEVVKSDGTAPFATRDLTVTYSVTGRGNLASSTVSFESGLVDLFSDANFNFGSTDGIFGANDGTRIASFSVTGGKVDFTTGLATVEAMVIAGSMPTGYFLSAGGEDLSGLANLALRLGVFNQPAAPQDPMVSELVCEFAQFTAAGCSAATFVNNPPYYFLVSDGGFASISPVPEPSSAWLVLAGLGILGGRSWHRRPARMSFLRSLLGSGT